MKHLSVCLLTVVLISILAFRAEGACPPVIQRFQIGCNIISYMPNGTLGNLIPLVGCTATNEIIKSCPPGVEFKLNCNTCKCGADGKGAGCSKVGCVNFKCPNDCAFCKCTQEGVSLCLT